MPAFPYLITVTSLQAICPECEGPRPYARVYCSGRCKILAGRRDVESKETRKEYRAAWARRKRQLARTDSRNSPGAKEEGKGAE